MNKRAIVTGASRGIGLALCKDLLKEGHTVIGTSRFGKISDISDAKFSTINLDLTDAKSIDAFAKKVKEKNTGIDLLINNAGIGPDLEFAFPEPKSFNETFQVNVAAIVELTEQLIPLMNSGGRILNVSSKMGSIAECTGHGAVAYRMSKSALNMYTKILSNRIGHEIGVASMHPGWVKTSITLSNLTHARLTPEESSKKIMDYLKTNFKNGDFWDAERGIRLDW